MKLKLATILFAASVMFSMTSCEEMTNPGEGQLPPLAGEVVLTDVLTTNGSRVSPNYVLEFEIGTENATKDGSGAVLYAKILCNAPALPAGSYTEASPAYATAGNFVTGEEGTKLYLDGKKYLVTAGTINVKVVEGNYTIDAIVKLNNGENYSVSFTGKPMTWEGLPIMKKLNKVISAQSNLANGTKSVTLNLSDGNFTAEYDAATNQTTYTGTGNYLAVDLYSEDGYLAAGTYTPSAAGGTIKAGEYGIGWDPGDLWGNGMVFSNWGTCWWTVDGSATPATTAEKLTTGNITVTLVDNVYTVTVDNGELYAQFVGEIPAVTPPAVPPAPPVLRGTYPHFVGMSDQYDQYKSVILQFATTDALKSTGMGWTGTGKAFNLTINAVKEGDNFYIPTGKYDVNESGAENPFTWQATGGMDFGEWGYMYWGTYIADVVDGTQTVTELKDGTIWVGAKNGDYIFNIQAGGEEYLIYQGQIKGLTTPADDDGGYVAPEPEGGEEGESGACGCDCDACKDCTGGEEGGEEEDSFNGTILTGLGGWIDYAMFGMNMLGLDFYSTGCTVSNSWWQYTYTGTGNHLKLELYCEGGVVTPGVYEITTVASAPEPGQVKAGDDTGGSEWYDVVDGTASLVGKITDGTVTIEQEGDTYTLPLPGQGSLAEG